MKICYIIIIISMVSVPVGGQTENDDGKYDMIVIGSGIKEFLLSAILSKGGWNILHIGPDFDGENAMSDIENLYTRFNRSDVPTFPGNSSDWQIDLVPKFRMKGDYLEFLLKLVDVERSLEFKTVPASYVYARKDRNIHVAPTLEANGMLPFLYTDMFSLLVYCYMYPDPQFSFYPPLDRHKSTTSDLYSKYPLLSDEEQDILGHAIALYADDKYKDYRMKHFINRVKFYLRSSKKNGGSPYQYPVGGQTEILKELKKVIESNGGRYITEDSVNDQIEIRYEDNKVIGVEADGRIFRTQRVLSDPSHLPDKVVKVAQVVRMICIMNHTLKDLYSKELEPNAHIIITPKQVNRSNDIYITMMSEALHVAPRGYYVATISTRVETENPEDELKPALELLEPIIHKFTSVTDVYEPTTGLENTGVFKDKHKVLEELNFHKIRPRSMMSI